VGPTLAALVVRPNDISTDETESKGRQ